MAPVRFDQSSSRRSDHLPAIQKTRRTAHQLTVMLDKACDQLELLQRKIIDLNSRLSRAENTGHFSIVNSLFMQLKTVAEVRRCYYKVAEKLAEQLQEHQDVAQ